MKNVKEIAMKYVFMVSAAASILAVFLICVFLFANGVPAMREVGFLDFLFGTKWAPSNVPASFSIFPMIVGSIYVTAGAIIVGVPIGILTAVFMARFCPKGIYKFLKPAVDLLAGIPSIIYGFFGLVVIVPVVRMVFERFDTNGNWLQTSWDVRINNLPEAITAYVNANFAGYRIDDADYYETPSGNFYKIEVERGEWEQNIFLDADGNLVTYP